MAKEKGKGKIDPKKLKAASNKLKFIIKFVEEYDQLWRKLSQQEKALIGGIIFNIYSDWDNLNVLGAIVNRPLGAAMINRLVSFFNQPRPPGKPPPPSITIPGQSSGNGDLTN